MITMITMIAGISWEPEIRGLLTVALGLAVLGGSVWLLLVTNTGTRLGSLIALAGFWGWMFIMGIFWWIYGIGWVGSLPTWEVEETFIDAPGAELAGIGDAFIGNVEDLPDTNCFDGVDSFPPAAGVASIDLTDDLVALCTPRAIEVLMAYPGPERESVIREMLNPQTDESRIENIVNGLFGTPLGEPDEMLAGLTSAQRDEVFDAIVEARYTEIADNIIANNAALGPADPRYLTDTSTPLTLQERIDIAQEAQTLRVDNMTLSALEATAPVIVE